MFKDITFYKPDIDKTFAELDRLYAESLAKRCGNVSLRVLPPCDIEFYPQIDLTKYAFKEDVETYADDLVAILDRSYTKRRFLADNMVPIISPILGIGDYSAFVAGDIIFKPDTSWGEHVLKEVDGWRELPPLGNSYWYRRFLEISEALIKRSAKQGIPFMRGFFSPLDLAHALRGEDIYYDIYDEPEKLHGLLDYCASATIRFAEDIYALVEKHYRGTKYGSWYSRGMINMSEDIACMISGEAYREFCRPHTQRVIDHFGTGHMHSHSRAMYLVKEICSLRNVVHLWLATDPNQPRPIEHLEMLIDAADSTVLAIDCANFSEIETNYQLLKQGNFSVCLPVDSVEAGVDAINR